jgi:hypothetical protein
LGGGFGFEVDHMTADATLGVSVAPPLVNLNPHFTNFQFPSPWDWIPLANVANLIVKPFKAFDLTQINIPIELLKEHYIGSSGTANAQNGQISLDVTLKKVP